MTVERAFPDCPECGSQGWEYGTTLTGEPEQIVCMRCGGSGVIDPADRTDNSEPMGSEPCS